MECIRLMDEKRLLDKNNHFSHNGRFLVTWNSIKGKNPLKDYGFLKLYLVIKIVATIKYILCYRIVIGKIANTAALETLNSSCKFFQVELQLLQSFANRSNLTVKRITSAH
ncbi:hypothetical protein TNIN_494851 [Trichonephila inaurata madagascariensis]|uniref:Uncharacterized protein n=1 Tax=Trichonephila inaurata madagascariensis TaxID=2747483 RepID=A0A8X6X0N6_9ARAC|nr:hypothetical protein TNIN_494851 [Trichonephila inaurata madagascariensis]